MKSAVSGADPHNVEKHCYVENWIPHKNRGYSHSYKYFLVFINIFNKHWPWKNEKEDNQTVKIKMSKQFKINGPDIGYMLTQHPPNEQII